VLLKIKKEAVYHNQGFLIMYTGDLSTTCFDPKEPSSDTCIKITKKSYWVMIGLCINEISFSYSNTYPTKCNVTQFTLSGNCSTCFR
jgi:hypothetical protein